MESRRAGSAAGLPRIETWQIFGATSRPGFGPAGRNNFRGPFQSRFDLSLHKTFRLSERFRLQYQLDAFNLFNTPSFDAPNNNSQLNASYSDFPSYQQAQGFGVTQNTIGSPRFLQMSLHLSF